MHLHIIKVHELNDIKALMCSLIKKALINMIINSNGYTVNFAYTDKKKSPLSLTITCFVFTYLSSLLIIPKVETC